ncbi:hypothetical protein SBOR_0174 [Sclerotinia borealis F-4128]|uniref:glucan endo-1,3-beta-D-glucosidase n=1 Tax=Sclerotinia borealis (strain F-4128) TaxID=1432307 RepID=W9CRJ6_SCLBF|nr:hypothetical protein SBOR_0174 [Sclerotinia borealis F-4128]
MSRYSFQDIHDYHDSSSPVSVSVSPQTIPSRYHSPSPSPTPTPLSPYDPLNPASNSIHLPTQEIYNQQIGMSNPSFSHSQQNYEEMEPVSPIIDSPPIPPPHRSSQSSQESRIRNQNSNNNNNNTISDQFGNQPTGGINGVAMRSVANSNARQSGVDMRSTPGYDPAQPSYREPPFQRSLPRQDVSTSSLTPLNAAAFPTGMSTPSSHSTISGRNPPLDPYSDSPYPYNRYSRAIDPELVEFDPNIIADDGDDGLGYRRANRSSVLSLNKMSEGGTRTPPVGKAVAAGGVIGTLGGLVGKKNGENIQYNNVTNAQNGYSGPGNYDLSVEKNEWLKKPPGGNKKMRLWIALLVGFLIVGAIIGGAVGGTLAGNSKSSSGSGTSQDSTNGQSASSDTSQHGDLDKNSAEIKKLLNNPNLHKVFPGIDYTPMYTQYPACLTYPASQNNVTRDMAVLSQLSNTIRLYGTDCNQTELVLHAIDQLGLNGTVKVWLGVWQDSNATTNTRQLEQLYSIFDTHGPSSFIGVIVGNEVLYREDMTATELVSIIGDVKSNMTTRGIHLPVASSDLGDNWTAELANAVDFVMANIHPFFAGVTAEQGASWTWDFWQNHDVAFKTNASQNIISETGWPSTGGTDCGAATTCVEGSVAGISEMNTFMDNWVCDAITNGTNYFWFEAFDEPWKIQYNSGDQNWEDHWGIMDVNRVLKDGVKIPSCGGKTVS